MPNLDFLNTLGDAMGDVYAACHDRLLINLARHFMYLKPGEEPGGAFKYQARKLLDNGKAYGFIDKDFADIRVNFGKWAEEFRKLTGKEYDPNDRDSPYYRGF